MSNERERLEDLQRIAKFRLLDDDFMTKCFEKHPKCVELVLRVIMGDNSITLKDEYSQTQYLIKNLQGRDVRFDIHAVDMDRSEYDLEIQRSKRGAGAYRARYNSSLMDANQIDSGDYGENLSDTYVIFITEYDVLNKGKAIYKIERYIDGENLFHDGAHIIYVNGSFVDDESAIGRLMHDFRCSNPDNMYYQILADRARFFKKTEEGEQIMCKMMEDMRNTAAQKAAINKELANIKALMETMKMSAEQAMKALKVPASEFKKYMAML